MIPTLALLSTLAAAASLASAAPQASKRAEDIDTTILQYALTLEHLENKFYSDAIAKFSQKDFENAGFDGWVYRRVKQIGSHEAQHVAFLETALGDSATKPCEYNFPYSTPAEFLGLSSAIEGVGVSAYLGAANKITNAAYLTAAASILTTESRHQAWVNSAALKGAAWSGPEDTPLGFSDVYSIAASFIKTCPDSNPKLPVKAFLPASISESAYKAGDKVTLKYKPSGQTDYLIVYSGLASSATAIGSDSTVTLPSGLQGTAYAVISTSQDASKVTDDNTVAGPIILGFGLPSSAVSSAYSPST